MTVLPLTHRVSAYNSIVEHITRNALPTHGHVHQLKSHLEGLRSSLAALVQMHGTPDPTRTRSFNDKRLIETASKLDDRRKQTFQNIQSTFGDGLRDIERRKQQKVKLQADAYAQEIRASIRAMTEPERLATMAQLAATNSGPALAAITEAPSILTGVSESHQKQFRELIMQTHAAAECAEEAILTEAFNAAVSATDVAQILARDLSNPTRLAEINRGVSAAAEAEAAFNNPVGA